MKRVAIIGAVALAVLSVGACQEPTSDVPPAVSLSIIVGVNDTISHSLTLTAPDTQRILVSAKDIFKRPASTSISFLSRSTLIASVTGAGLVKALREGSTWVIATAAGANNAILADSIRVIVKVSCTTEARPGLAIAVTDSITGSTGPFTAVSYVAKQGTDFRDSTLIAAVPASLSGVPFLAGLAYERAGTFDVSVKAANYKLWTKSGVVVTKDACHVTTVSLTARLIPQ